MLDFVEERKEKLLLQVLKDPVRTRVFDAVWDAGKITMIQLSSRLNLDIDLVRHHAIVLKRVNKVEIVGDRVECL